MPERPDPPVLVALKSLTASLQQITPANGYRYDLSTSVFRGRMLYGEGDPMPMVSIQQVPQMPEEAAPQNGPASGRLTIVPLLIQGFAEDDPQNPLDPAYYLLDDVERRLLEEKKRDDGFNVLGHGPKVQMTMGSGVVRSPDEIVSDTAFFWLPLTLEVANDLLA